MSTNVKVVFLRNVKRSGSYEPSWEDMGYCIMDTTTLPRTGDYIHAPLSDNLTTGTEVIGLIWIYDRVGVDTMCVNRVEIKIR